MKFKKIIGYWFVLTLDKSSKVGDEFDRALKALSFIFAYIFLSLSGLVFLFTGLFSIEVKKSISMLFLLVGIPLICFVLLIVYVNKDDFYLELIKKYDELPYSVRSNNYTKAMTILFLLFLVGAVFVPLFSHYVSKLHLIR